MSEIRFDAFVFEPETGRLRRDGGSGSTLRPKTARALACLLEHAPGLVSRDRLVEAVWPDDRVRDFEAGLSAILHELRRALGDDAAEPRLLETLPRRGYRIKVSARAGRRFGSMGVRVGATVVVLIVVAGVAGWWWQARVPLAWEGQVAVAPVIVYSGPEAPGSRSAGEPSWLLTDTLIAALWRHRPDGIEVIGRSSLERGETSRHTARNLGRRLGVRWVLHGWIRDLGEQWQFTLNLYEMPDASLRWSARFETDYPPPGQPDRLMERAVESLVAAGGKGF